MTLINLNITQFSNSMEMMHDKNTNNFFIKFIFIFFMWFFMMVAMMLPSAIPFIMIFDKINKERKKIGYQYFATINFSFSYLLVWFLFSFILSIIHIYMEFFDILNISTLQVGYSFGGMLFIFAGLYQMTPYKDTCLHHCRNPIEFFSEKKFYNNFDVFVIGLKHGLFCVGCCWVLMFLLFYAGIMNILWILGLTFYIFFEKYLIKSRKFNFLSGIILIFWGLSIFYFIKSAS